MTIQALRERIATLAKEVRALVEDKNTAWSADSQATYDAKLKEIDGLRASIDRLVQIDALMAGDKADAAIADAAAVRAKPGTGDAVRAIFDKWLRNGDRALSAEDWKTIRATMSTTTTTEGGYTVQTEVAKSIIEALKAYGGMRSVANVISTEQGNDINFTYSDGTSEEGEIVAQNASASDADMDVGSVTHSVFKYSSKVVTVPLELIQDSQIDVEAWVRSRLVTRLGRITNKHFTTGTGSAQPRGIVTAAAAGKVGATGQTTTVTFEDLVDLVHSIDPAYRERGACRFMMNDATLKVIRKMKDSSGRPIFIPGYDGLAGKMPDTLLGYEITINQHMATMAANAKSILFGDFTYYMIRDVMQVTLQRFDDSAYAKKGQVGFLGWLRSGGNLIGVGNEVKYYQNSAT